MEYYILFFYLRSKNFQILVIIMYFMYNLTLDIEATKLVTKNWKHKHVGSRFFALCKSYLV